MIKRNQKKKPAAKPAKKSITAGKRVTRSTSAKKKSITAGKRVTRSTSAKKRMRHAPARTKEGKVPQGRTLTTRDKYLDKKAKQPEKDRYGCFAAGRGHNH